MTEQNKDKVNELFVFLLEDDNGVEGVGAYTNTDGTTVPMIGSDEERVRHLLPMVEALTSQTGRSMKLVHFTGRRVVQEFSKAEAPNA